MSWPLVFFLKMLYLLDQCQQWQQSSCAPTDPLSTTLTMKMLDLGETLGFLCMIFSVCFLEFLCWFFQCPLWMLPIRDCYLILIECSKLCVYFQNSDEKSLLALQSKVRGGSLAELDGLGCWLCDKRTVLVYREIKVSSIALA